MMRHISDRICTLAIVMSGIWSAAARAYDAEPPVNPWLADSAWPMSHRNPYIQASSPLAAPTTAGSAAMVKSAPVTVSLVYSPTYADGTVVAWGNTLKEVFKIEAGSNDWKYLARKSRSQSMINAISGAYSLIDRDGTFFVPRGNTIEAYRDAVAGDPRSEIVRAAEFTIPANQLLSAEENIVGINLTWDGRIAFATDRALVGVVSRDFAEAAYLRLASTEEVSNSIAVDEDGGIYVVTDKAMYRAGWNDGILSRNWSTPYKSASRRSAGRLGLGSGTTPTLMGSGDDDRFVVIADGQTLMHLVLFWRDEIPSDWQGLPGRDRRIAAEVPINFGDRGARKSVTEQSVLVRGYDAAVVNNHYGSILPGGFLNIFDKLTIYLSNSRRVAPYGVQKFSWNPGTRTLNSAWTNPDVSCPNGVPTMSSATNLMYCVGQRRTSWNIEALDWSTGESVFYQNLGKSSAFNSFYAALGVGPAGSLASGMYGGVLRMQ